MRMAHAAERPLFREEQGFTQWWIWAVLLLVAGLAWWTFVQQIVRGIPFGTHPAPDWAVWLVLVLCGVGLPLFFLRCRLVTTVTPGRLQVHLRLVRRRDVPVGEILAAEVVEYRPLREYRGWGIRYNAKLGWAYTAHGHRGVRLRLAERRGLLVGSQRPEALVAALEEAGWRPAPSAPRGTGS